MGLHQSWSMCVMMFVRRWFKEKKKERKEREKKKERSDV